MKPPEKSILNYSFLFAVLLAVITVEAAKGDPSRNQEDGSPMRRILRGYLKPVRMKRVPEYAYYVKDREVDMPAETKPKAPLKPDDDPLMMSDDEAFGILSELQEFEKTVDKLKKRSSVPWIRGIMRQNKNLHLEILMEALNAKMADMWKKGQLKAYIQDPAIMKAVQKGLGRNSIISN